MTFGVSSRRAALAAMAGGILMLTGIGAVAQPADISGNYQVSGLNADGSAYSGVASIFEREGIVRMDWNVAGQTYAGNGVVEGRVVTVNWGASWPVVYVIMENGNLHGTWDNGRALELLTKSQ